MWRAGAVFPSVSLRGASTPLITQTSALSTHRTIRYRWSPLKNDPERSHYAIKQNKSAPKLTMDLQAGLTTPNAPGTYPYIKQQLRVVIVVFRNNIN